MVISLIKSVQDKIQESESKSTSKLDPKLHGERKRNSMDAELEEMLSKQKAKIKVVGCGGGGNNTINRMSEVGIEGAETVAVNTDAQDLLYTQADHKVLIGKELSRGLGAGGEPKMGEDCAKEQEKEIREVLTGSDMIFVTCGMGGGTGTGSAPVVAQIAKSTGALVVGIVTVPFTMEGTRRYENAMHGLENLEKSVDTLIVIPNDKLLELAPDLPLHTAFKVADEILTNAVKGVVELITKPGLVNLDFADVRAVMTKAGIALIGVGESDSDQRATESVEKAIANPLLDVNITGASGALINISGGSSMTLADARSVVETVSTQLDPNARIIWGAQIDEDLKKTMRVMLVVTGIKKSLIMKTKNQGKQETEKKMTDLEIEFID